MADYAADCGINIADAQLQTCLDEQAKASDQGACRRAGDADTLRREWECSDLEVFFQ